MPTPTPRPDVHHEPTAEPECDPALFVEFANRLPIAPFGARSPDADAEVAALRAWLSEHGLLRGRVARTTLKRELPAFRKFRTVIRAVATRLSHGERPTHAQIGAINAAMRDGLHYHALRPADAGQRFRMEQVGDELHQARATVAASLAHYLADHDPDRLRVCANDTCGWLFVDQSPAGRRRWCDMRICGNRAKVAAHRARARTEAVAGPQAAMRARGPAPTGASA